MCPNGEPSLSQPALPVPVFFLYGEPRRSVSPRFLHLEALEQRSRPTDWNIRPHVHADLHHLFLIAGGSGRMDADGSTTRFAAPCLLAVPARTVHGFTWERETHGYVLTLADSYLRDLLARAPDFSPLFAMAGCLLGADAEAIGERLASFGRELAWSAPAHAAAVEDHAAWLGVTPPMLRRACTQVARYPPIRIIHERLFLEAQRVLLHTNMSIGESAAYLGFEDSAYFTCFFTKRAGQSPKRFRTAGHRG